MKITILGSTGMLGSAVGKHFLKIYGEDNVFLSHRKKNERYSYGKNRFKFSAFECRFWDIPKSDYIINCIGVIKPHINNNILHSILVNSCFPRLLANYFINTKTKVIHITTDCVFSGKKGNYIETDVHDCADIYGKTKSLGEPDNCMVIRTSIIGEEIHSRASLVEWLKLQSTKDIQGFANHFWNGMTTKEYAKICEKIIEKKLYKKGLFHIFSDTVSKFTLLCILNERFSLGVNINMVQAETNIDRTLNTVNNLCSMLDILPIEQQIREM